MRPGATPSSSCGSGTGVLTDGQRQYVKRILDATIYQASLIEDILDFAGQHGQRRRLDISTVDVEEVIGRAETLLAVRADEEGRRLRREPMTASGRVSGDPRAIQQILLNLGTNAIKFSPPDTKCFLRRAWPMEPWWHRDSRSRSGDCADQLERIFEPFVRVDTEAARRTKGLGLGLAISRDLARSMNGDIRVESEISHGSLFSLELPAAA